MHIIVAGCGPAGLLVAAAIAARGVAVAVAAPSPEDPWPAQYGVWRDEIESLGFADVLDPVWETVDVRLDDDRVHHIERAYGRIDGVRLQQRLLAAIRDAGGTFIPDTVERIDHHDRGTTVRTAAGETLKATVFIDATGHSGHFVQRVQAGGATAFQTAWGVLAAVARGPATPDMRTMLLMDFSSVGGTPPRQKKRPPTFLYAMPFADGRIFFEETVLTGDPEVPVESLQPRLDERLAGLGYRVLQVEHTERCRIPMNTPMPVLPQRTVGFGGAASLVHPATGYLVAHCMRLAPQVADALVTEADRAGATPDSLAAAAWSAIWPADARRVHELTAFGGELLARMPIERLRDFFHAFFRAPDRLWRGYLSRTLSPRETRQLMGSVFRRAPMGVRFRLMREGVRHWRQLLRGLFGSRRHRQEDPT